MGIQVVEVPITDAPPIRRPGSKEIAVLEVRGQLYSNWTSVRVEQKWAEAFPVFQFECTEEVSVPLTVAGSQFVPGDIVRVFLGGHSAIFGYITERHVGYDATNHGIRLIGCGDTIDLVDSSVPLDKLDGHDGQSVTQLARELSQHLGVDILTKGNVDETPFENIQVQPGETPISAIERYAKMRNIVIGSNANGGLLLIGEHPVTTSGYLVESINILRANVALRDNKVFKRIFSIGTNKGGDDAYGDSENKQAAVREGSSTRARDMVVVADVADKMHGIQRRADMEYTFTEGSNIEAQITVQGWFKDGNTSEDIWRAGEYYAVTSPSLIMYDEVLGCAACVYEQNDGGTTTTLTMVKPVHMNGRFNFRQENLAYRAKQRADELARRQAAAAQAAAAEESAR